MHKIEWKAKSKPELVLKRLADATTVTDKGVVSYEGGEHLTLMPALHNMIVYKNEYSFKTKVMFREKAFRICSVEGRVTKAEFIKELRKQAAIYDQTDFQKFYMTTSLSIRHGELPRRVLLPNSTAFFYPGPLPKKYNTRQSVDPRWKSLFPSESPLPRKYTGVVVSVRAKNESDAFDIAMRDLNFFRGLLCLRFNPDLHFSFGSSSAKPLNKVMLGGMHCVHKENGRLAGPEFWYESHFSEKAAMQTRESQPRNRVALRRYLKFRFRYISNYPMADQVKLCAAIGRYALALDEHDHSASVHKLWSAMESLVSPGQKSEVLISRCAYTCDDPDYHAQVLTYLKDYRNSHIHEGSNDGEAEQHCFTLQRYFRHMIAFYFGLSDFFISLDEANSFLDSSNDVNVLDRKIEMLQRAKKYVLSA